MIDAAAIDRTKHALQALGAERGPIIVGPWLSEVGFEVLYWVPWLRWAIQYAGLHPDDLTIVSRGGARSWYEGIGAHYVDVLDFYTPAELCAGGRRRVEEQAARARSMGLKHAMRSAKQHMVTAFDQDILARIGHADARLLHPSMMYAFFRPFWKRATPNLYRQSTVVRRLTPPSDVALNLPASYVAMKFYSSQALSDTPQHRQMVQDIVSAQVQQSDVVLLHSGTQYDEHGEFPIESHPRVHRVALPPEKNLDIQTAVIAGASGYVGTYGGFAYLAPFLGVQTLAIYGEANFRRDHQQVMATVASAHLWTPFSVEQIRKGISFVPKRIRRAA